MKNDSITVKVEKVVQNPYVIFLSYIIAIIDIFIKNDNIYLIFASRIFICIYLLLLSAFIVRKYFSINVFKKNLITSTNANNKETLSILLEFCNLIVESSLMVKRKKALDYEHFREIIKNICSTINRLVIKISDEKFNVCVKAFCLNDLVETNYDSRETITIARDTNNYMERSLNDDQKQIIKNNTSFKELLDSGDCLWSCPDLTRIDPKVVAGSTYKNPDENYRNFYKSTIVVPIRTKMKWVNQKVLRYSSEDNHSEYHYLGFLCIDSMHVFCENDTEFARLCNYMMLFGIALYPVLENYLINEIDRM